MLGTAEVLLIGFAGGLLPDMIRIIKARYEVKFPSYLSCWNFWVGVLLLGLLGAATAWVLESANYKEALAYGFGAPEIISRVVSSQTSQVTRGGKFEMRAWWAS